MFANIQNNRIFASITSLLPVVLIAVFCSAILFLSLRGIPGNPSTENMNQSMWKDEGPFELSPERGRFALMYSLLEDKSFQFSTSLAQFASPDVAFSNGQFVSLFAPALSFVIMPGYMIGKYFGMAQLGTYAMISFFALLNVFLIRAIAIRLKCHPLAATVAGMLFLFATPAFAYAVSLYQHHVSTFLILVSFYVLIRWNNIKSLMLIWLACATSVVLDNPNFFFMLPIGLFALGRLIFVERVRETVQIHIKPLGLLSLIVMAIPMAGFAYVNYKSYGNPFQLAGTTANASIILKSQGAEDVDVADLRPTEGSGAAETIEDSEEDSKTSSIAVGFFKTRNIRNGLYTHLISLDRGTLMYAPLMLLGFIGLFLLGREHIAQKQLFIAVFATILVVYSMWGDPYGGWAFGSRYMIPAYAVLSIGLAHLLTKYRHNLFVLLFISALAGYSIFVNTIGAITTNRNPPKVQVLSLEEMSGQIERYTYKRGMEMLDNDRSKSFVYRTYAKPYVSAWYYAIGIMIVIGGVNLLLLLSLFLSDRAWFMKRNTQAGKEM